MEINDFQFQTGPVGPIGPRPTQAPRPSNAPSFGDVFQQKAQELKFSGHATARLKSRNIELDAAKMAKLADAVERAAAKGSRDSLVLMDNTAFVVSVKNRTVITAVDGASLKDNVFTNIDSAVIA